MDDLLNQVEQLNNTRVDKWGGKEGRLFVSSDHDERTQTIHVRREKTDYVFKTVVLNAKRVTVSNKRWRELAKLVWQRNAEHQVVTFGFDEKDNLIGQIRHPAELLDPVELELYIHTLASECDRFEYLLTGEDVQ
jgi:hypothetical protein